MKELTFIKDDRAQDKNEDPCLKSWQNYREEIRKKLGHTNTNILIEDQVEKSTPSLPAQVCEY